jgi:hypothetical protein
VDCSGVGRDVGGVVDDGRVERRERFRASFTSGATGIVWD